LNGVYPSHPLRGVLLVALLTALKKYKNIDISYGLVKQIENHLPHNWVSQADRREIAACVVFASGTWLSIVTLRKYSLQALFSYHDWMYESRGKSTFKSKAWLSLVKLLIGSSPNLYSYQNSLPYLPVPALKETMQRYLRTVKPLLDDDAYRRVEREALDFQSGVGKRLQRYLTLKSFISSNYVSDWWEEYVYLRGRSPIMVNSNFYALDAISKPPTSRQASRAANCIAAALMYRKKLDDETLEPIMLQGQVPLCSRQYERQFNTTRIPGELTDKLVHLKDSKHVAVYCKGKWYKLNTYYNSKVLNAKELEG
jgi:carnitine O-palmitoyltransferase 1